MSATLKSSPVVPLLLLNTNAAWSLKPQTLHATARLLKLAGLSCRVPLIKQILIESIYLNRRIICTNS